MYVELDENINGHVYAGYSNTRTAMPGGYWQCTGQAQTINVAVFPESGDPAFRTGKGTSTSGSTAKMPIRTGSSTRRSKR